MAPAKVNKKSVTSGVPVLDTESYISLDADNTITGIIANPAERIKAEAQYIRVPAIK